MTGDGSPLRDTTWEMDRAEGLAVSSMKAARTEQYPDPLIEVPDDLQRSVMVTALDELINWSRKSTVWPLSFGLALPTP